MEVFKGNVWSLDFSFISNRTSGRKLKLIRKGMCINNNVIRLQCTLVLGDYHKCEVIGINQKHEGRISNNIPCLDKRKQMWTYFPRPLGSHTAVRELTN